MDDKLRLQPEGRGDGSAAHGDGADLLPGQQKLRSRSRVDPRVSAAADDRQGVRRIHNGIAMHTGDVVSDDLKRHFGHLLFSFIIAQFHAIRKSPLSLSLSKKSKLEVVGGGVLGELGTFACGPSGTPAPTNGFIDSPPFRCLFFRPTGQSGKNMVKYLQYTCGGIP